MLLSICNELFEGWPFDRVCAFVRSIGYEGIEVAPFTLAPRITAVSAAERATLGAQAADAGVAIAGLHWLLARTEGFHVTSPDPATRRSTAEYLVELAQACRDLGGSVMVFGSPKQRSRLPGVSPAQAVDFAVDTFGQALSGVADCGVTICMEPLSPEETDFVNTCAEGGALVAAVNHPNFVLHLDVKAMSAEPTPVAELIGRHGGRAGHFHANDSSGRGPGFGDTDFVPIFRALDDAGYRRWVSVEVFDFAPDPETIARRSIEYLKACRQQKESMA